MTGPTVLAAIEAACGALAGAGVRFALVGGAALPAWGRTRATADADVLVALEEADRPRGSSLTRIVERLRAAGFAHLERTDRLEVGGYLILHFWFPIRTQSLSIRVDLLITGDRVHQAMLERATTRRIDGFSVPVASCEDLILLKLAAGRPVDLADVEALIDINRTGLDMAYLRSQAAALGVQKALQIALGRSS